MPSTTTLLAAAVVGVGGIYLLNQRKANAGVTYIPPGQTFRGVVTPEEAAGLSYREEQKVEQLLEAQAKVKQASAFNVRAIGSMAGAAGGVAGCAAVGAAALAPMCGMLGSAIGGKAAPIIYAGGKATAKLGAKVAVKAIRTPINIVKSPVKSVKSVVKAPVKIIKSPIKSLKSLKPW